MIIFSSLKRSLWALKAHDKLRVSYTKPAEDWEQLQSEPQKNQKPTQEIYREDAENREKSKIQKRKIKD